LSRGAAVEFMILRDSCGRHFRKSIVNDYVRNKMLPRNIRSLSTDMGEYHFVDTECCGNVSRTYIG